MGVVHSKLKCKLPARKNCSEFTNRIEIENVNNICDYIDNVYDYRKSFLNRKSYVRVS
jgi:hypothetical protein